MPNHDGTGPRGQGPATGRGMGRCGAGKKVGGVGVGRGTGKGRVGRNLPQSEKTSSTTDKNA